MPSSLPELLFSTSGRIDQRTFAFAILAFYAAGFASQFLLSGQVTGRAGPWPFALAQALLTWIWFALHAKRMRDAGRGIGGSLTVAIIYAVPILLLVLFMAAFIGASSDPLKSGAGSGVGSALILFFVIALLTDPSRFNLLTFVLLFLLFFAYVPMLLAVIWSIWTGTRPSASQP
jgi:uncharacterized membrane protein YhaH (DUF805 family)